MPTLKNRIMLVCQSKDPKELNNIFLYMRFKLGYDYDRTKAFFKKCASIDDQTFEQLTQIAHDFMQSLRE